MYSVVSPLPLSLIATLTVRRVNVCMKSIDALQLEAC